jgi:hypothetical protein
MLMPAFSFEKISPPVPGAAEAPTPTKIDGKADKKPRGVIVQVLDRIAEARAKRGQPKE